MISSQARSNIIPAYKKLPVVLLIVGNIIIGLFTFQDYGLSLDEPLFYRYAQAIGYAYSPTEWFGGDFVLERAFGPSPADHGNRGPAYLLLARLPAKLIQALGFDLASSWHLVNFLAFQFGLYFFYQFCHRWMSSWGAFAATLFLSTQPLLWEHAFINPKDPPFLVFFLITLELGFRMVDRIVQASQSDSWIIGARNILLPAIMLGLTTNLRVIGPLAGVLVGLYFLTQRRKRGILWLLPYGIIAILTLVITWPYLWESPFVKFIQVIRFMADNPTQLRVLFYGQLYNADNLPLRYLPAMMLFTMTEPLWPLAAMGVIVAAYRIIQNTIDWKSLAATSVWFIVPFAYVLLKQPPMYDGFRHFFFILPPLFVSSGIAFDLIAKYLKSTWLSSVLVFLLVLPGLYAGIKLHPYQYTYYNSFIGGTGEAAFSFETDYWLTCYKEAIEELGSLADEPVTLYVQREFYIAGYYATNQIAVKDLQAKDKTVESGDFILWSSRANPGLQRFRDPRQVVLRVERDGALFCVTQRQ